MKIAAQYECANDDCKMINFPDWVRDAVSCPLCGGPVQSSSYKPTDKKDAKVSNSERI
jgi:endogenous inhibitor of DNA gyrase (YacG/DUF329 family)